MVKQHNLTLEKPNILYAAIANTLGMWVLLLTLSIFPLFLTIIREIRKCLQPPSKSSRIIDTIKDEEGRNLFFNFSDSEWSTENISCYEDIELYKKEKDFQKRKERANQIYYLYLNGNDSKLEINIQQKHCIPIYEHIKIDTYPSNLFETVEEIIIENMCDTFSRFEISSDYSLYLKRSEFFGGYKKIPQS